MRRDAGAARGRDEEGRGGAGIRAGGPVARPAGGPEEHHQEGQPVRARALQPAAGASTRSRTWRSWRKRSACPRRRERIEGFDISNISGTFKVASLVSFRHGRPDRANYRRFKIKTVEGQDDFASVAEVVRRRYTRVLRESKGQSPTSAARGDLPEGEREEIRSPKAQRNERGPLEEPELPPTASLAPAGDDTSSATVGNSTHTQHAPRTTQPLPPRLTSFSLTAARGSLGRRARNWRSWGWAISRRSGWPRSSRRSTGRARRSRSGLSHESGALKLLAARAR